MTTLYIQEQGASVRKQGQQIVVVKDGETLREVPLQTIDQIVLMGRGVQISTALLIDLVSRGVPVMLTNARGSRFHGLWSGGPSRFGDLRTRQISFVGDVGRALELARAIVRAKLTNQQALLAGTGWAAGVIAVRQIEQQLASADAAPTIDTLRGYEGAAAAAYFGAWRASLPASWGFGGRAYFPPPDPVNALLSFGYTLALNDVLTAIHITGLDPYLGTFHVTEAGRPSLALDLLEEFRPLLIDRLVLELLATNAFGRVDFERPAQQANAVYLTKDGRARFVARYEALLAAEVPLPSGERTTMRRVLLLQAQAFARVIRGEQEQYVGYSPGR
jgi:CRISP-associated protein Cas1